MAGQLESCNFDCDLSDIDAPESEVLTGGSAKDFFGTFTDSPKPLKAKKPENSRLSRKYRPPPKRPLPPPKKKKLGISFLDSGDDDSTKILKKEETKPPVIDDRSPSVVLVSKKRLRKKRRLERSKGAVINKQNPPKRKRIKPNPPPLKIDKPPPPKPPKPKKRKRKISLLSDDDASKKKSPVQKNSKPSPSPKPVKKSISQKQPNSSQSESRIHFSQLESSPSPLADLFQSTQESNSGGSQDSFKVLVLSSDDSEPEPPPKKVSKLKRICSQLTQANSLPKEDSKASSNEIIKLPKKSPAKELNTSEKKLSLPLLEEETPESDSSDGSRIVLPVKKSQKVEEREQNTDRVKCTPKLSSNQSPNPIQNQKYSFELDSPDSPLKFDNHEKQDNQSDDDLDPLKTPPSSQEKRVLRSSEDDLIGDKEKGPEKIENVSQSPKMRKHSLEKLKPQPADQLANNVEVIDLTDSPHPVKKAKAIPLEIEPVKKQNEARASPARFNSPKPDKESPISQRSSSSPDPLRFSPPKKKRRLQTPEANKIQVLSRKKSNTPNRWSITPIESSNNKRLKPSKPGSLHVSPKNDLSPMAQLIKELDPEPEENFVHHLSQEDELSFARNHKINESPKSTWNCKHCTFANLETSMLKCRMCHRVRDLVSTEKWACPRCTYANDMSCDVCKICQLSKEAENSDKTQKKYAFEDDSEDMDDLFFTQSQHVVGDMDEDEIISKPPPKIDSGDGEKSEKESPLNEIDPLPDIVNEANVSCDDRLSDLDFDRTPSPLVGREREDMLIKLGYCLPSPLKDQPAREKRKAELKALAIPKLKKEAAKFGLGPASKGAMIDQLMIIWDHKNMTERDKKKLLQVPNSPPKLKKKKKSKKKGNKLSAKEKKEIEFQAFEEKLCAHIRSCDVWYEKILLFRSIDYDTFLAYVKEKGLNPPSDKALKEILDKHGVTYATGSGKKRHARKRKKKFWWGRKNRGRGRGRGRRGRARRGRPRG